MDRSLERIEARLTQELGNAFVDLRSQLSVALSTVPGSPLDTTTRSRHYDLPTPGSYPSRSAFPPPPPARARPLSDSFPSSSRRPPSDDEDDDGQPRPTEVAGRDDELPAYTPRASLPSAPDEPRRVHAYESRSGRLRLAVEAAGEAHILLLQPLEGDGKVWLEGELRVTLAQPEAITHVKIRLKGLVRTMVMRIHGSGRHPVTEDVLIWEDAKTLWTAPDHEEPARLQGTHVFPFKLHLPARVNLAVPPRRVRLPPSFVLSSADAQAGAKGTEWASCRYFVKVTLGRKGFLKVNERIIVPVIYAPRVRPPEGSVARSLALLRNLPAPGPLEDPAGWAGTKTRHPVKRGIFNGKKAWYEVVLLVPTSCSSLPRFSRLGMVDFAIKIVSSDPGVTSTFPPGCLSVCLIQRSFVSAQGLSGTHDILVAQTCATVDGPDEGTWIPKHEQTGDDPPVWGKRFHGSMKLTHNIGSSFRAPNLVVQFLLSVRVTVAGGGNDAELSWPIEILPSTACIRPIASAAPIPMGIPSTLASAPPPPPGFETPSSPQDPSLRLGLPPSYFAIAS